MRLLSGLSPRRCWRGLALLLAGALLSLSIVPASLDAQRTAKPKSPRAAAAVAARGKAKATPRPARRAKASARARASARAASRRSQRAGRLARRSRNRTAYAPVIPKVAKATVVTDSAPILRDSVVALARQQLGTAYILGAQKPGEAFDCSGLVRYVMGWLNIRLPRTANEQAYTGIAVGKQLDRFKPGDLLTFGDRRRITHIGVYVGDGKYVHASRPGVGVVESVLNPAARRFRGAVRLVADANDTTGVSSP
ncbi:MAG: C40 family peptidase [Gemmatimonadaceae bacterium]|jgi:cell wall-associated NlpC family hydrolase|nr:C40 family peptidase [Gemmatimonadaceae bacterium]